MHAQLSEALDSNIAHLKELSQQQKQANLERLTLQQELAKQARETKAMEQRFTRLTDLSPVAISIARLDGTVIYVGHSRSLSPSSYVVHSYRQVIELISSAQANNTWHRLFGDGPESYQPMSWLGMFFEEDLERASQLWANLATEDNVIDYEFRVKRPWVSSISNDIHMPYTSCMGSAYATHTNDGQVEVISTLVDVSHHKWISQESQKRTNEAITAKKQQVCVQPSTRRSFAITIVTKHS